MSQLFPRVYRSFEEFERIELRKLDSLYDSVGEMVDEMLLAELGERSRESEAVMLFDEIGDD